MSYNLQRWRDAAEKTEDQISWERASGRTRNELNGRRKKESYSAPVLERIARVQRAKVDQLEEEEKPFWKRCFGKLGCPIRRTRKSKHRKQKTRKN
jgi:hypothetical protein